MSVEFTCEKCHALVYALGIEKPPAHGLCATCWFLEEFVRDPDEREAIRTRIEHLGEKD